MKNRMGSVMRAVLLGTALVAGVGEAVAAEALQGQRAALSARAWESSRSRISLGDVHGMAVDPEGGVWTWGNNAMGSLGDGTNVNRFVPGRVPGLEGMSSVMASLWHSLALREDGTVWGWGGNSLGQLGDGTTEHRLSPVQAVGLSNVVSIATGSEHSLALREDGTVWGWGNNGWMQIGHLRYYDWLLAAPVQVRGITDVVAISAGSLHSVMLRKDGTVWTQGDNSHGQLGDPHAYFPEEPVRVVGLTDVVAISSGDFRTLALRADGTVWGWGNGQPVPVQVAGLTDVVSISASDSHALALRADGTLWSWGDNISGQLGDGTTLPRDTPAPVPGLTAVAAIETSSSGSMALRQDGSLWAWGQNMRGVLGDGTEENRLTPTRVLLPYSFAGLSSGEHRASELQRAPVSP
ncbi:hypothetical protein [Archangium sp.]|uniref:RCC1 domain-containing protein n=1 Tax=Archangium sp. TaxID=1872627 RepID=UPI002D4409AE|nr:hypothetical protein [Archangium sp.]HYO52711.1 hypothetical protein [Archangium sp.]